MLKNFKLIIHEEPLLDFIVLNPLVIETDFRNIKYVNKRTLILVKIINLKYMYCFFAESINSDRN